MNFVFGYHRRRAPPDMSGIELQQRLRSAGPAPAIFVTTSIHETVMQERAQQNGLRGAFWKPVEANR